QTRAFLSSFSSPVHHRYLHSFPTRRSSDLLLPGPSHFVGVPEYSGYENNTDDNSTANIRAYLGIDYELFHNFRITSATSYDYFTDRKSTRLNSSHVSISYAVFCLKKKIIYE